MNNKQAKPPVQYSYEQLNSLILLQEKLTGEKPTELHVTPNFYTWFIQECARDVDNLKKYRQIEAKLPTEPTHLGVLIKKKVKIVK